MSQFRISICFLALAGILGLVPQFAGAQEGGFNVTGNVSFTDQSLAAAPSASSPAQAGSASDDDKWHFYASPYLWFPGVHGAVGGGGRTIGVHASPGDLLSNFRFGLMGAFEARHKWLVLPLDMMWVRLGDDQALSFPGLAATTANFRASEFILTPGIGVRLINEERIKIDALTGFRYWHLGESLEFSPSTLGLDFSDSQDWVDPLVGGRIQTSLTPKIVVNILGDVGGWGTGSELEYQVAGLLGYRINRRWTLQAGYRYMDVNYRSGGSVFDVAMSGAAVGATINLNPAPAPTP